MEQQAGYLWFSEGVPNLVQPSTGLHLYLTYPNPFYIEKQTGYLWFSEGVPNLVQSLTGLHLYLTYPNLAPHISNPKHKSIRRSARRRRRRPAHPPRILGGIPVEIPALRHGPGPLTHLGLPGIG